jgi:hypothetical protein
MRTLRYVRIFTLKDDGRLRNHSSIRKISLSRVKFAFQEENSALPPLQRVASTDIELYQYRLYGVTSWVAPEDRKG